MLTITLSVIFYSCNDEDSNKDIYLKNTTLSSCENVDKSTYRMSESEYFKFSAINNNTLKVEHKFFMNCCTEDIGLKIDSKENNITINLTDADGDCNCVCPKVASCEIVNLQVNNKYKFIFFRNAQEYYTIELFFTFPMEQEIPL